MARNAGAIGHDCGRRVSDRDCPAFTDNRQFLTGLRGRPWQHDNEIENDMDFSLSPAQLDLQQRTRSFIADEVIPMESDPRQDSHGPHEALRDDLVAKARRHGLLTPHASKAHGGLGLSHVDKAIVFEEAGYSPLGPVALNIHAPDEGNVHLMEVVATESQKARWLQPLIDGHVRSCFCMTEPPPGAGSDPSMMQTLAVRPSTRRSA